MQDGYLNEQDRAGTAGNRYLYYDAVYGVFELFTVSHAKIKCDMDFSLYPFDTQTCWFTMSSSTNLSYQGYESRNIIRKILSNPVIFVAGVHYHD